MDYSLLIGIHNIEVASASCDDSGSAQSDDELVNNDCIGFHAAPNLETWNKLQNNFSTLGARESVYSPVNTSQYLYVNNFRQGILPAKNTRGDHLLIYLGIIDILQSYGLFKKLERTWKSIILGHVSILLTLLIFN